MPKSLLILLLSAAVITPASGLAQGFATDRFQTAGGDLAITFIGHGTLMFAFGPTVIHVDPWTQLADYKTLPKADIVLITHEHRDHLDLAALDQIRKEDTVVIASASCRDALPGATVMQNGDKHTVKGIAIAAVPAYNLVHMRGPGQPYHPKGNGNGYVIGFADKRIYVAGDTENTPEMKALTGIDLAFLPMNLPYTMTPDMVADAARSLKPKVLYPYHFGDTDTSLLTGLLKTETGIEVRIRNLK